MDTACHRWLGRGFWIEQLPAEGIQGATKHAELLARHTESISSFRVHASTGHTSLLHTLQLRGLHAANFVLPQGVRFRGRRARCFIPRGRLLAAQRARHQAYGAHRRRQGTELGGMGPLVANLTNLVLVCWLATLSALCQMETGIMGRRPRHFQTCGYCERSTRRSLVAQGSQWQ